ncbi:unnamed protein product [Rotaria magnacalcarata]|uniref:Helix-turn-helix domain-containing protein n=1 Tax=Rotaria magnacalcarata TaxID=392030 RepID=A0A816N6V5_9BILA|nr:unnamed protein product [Rotaria magnacalcarata]
MYFFERQIVNQIRNSSGLYFRYIDDIFITINWPVRHLLKEVDRWNKFDENINLTANIGSIVNFLDLNMENRDGQLYTTVFQKPSYEPYYLPFNSIHPLHMKKNISFAMLLRAIRYCSTFQSYLNEREKLRMALLLNKYPNKIIDEQFDNVLVKFDINEPLTSINYNRSRQKIIDSPIKEKLSVNYDKSIFVHFTYCTSMKTFPIKFHALWDKYFDKSPINEVIPILGTRNVDNLQRRLIHTKSNGALIISVYHKEAAESYVVPFGSDHPDHVFRNTVDTAITRGVRYSTTLSQFEEEIRQMKLMFLYNGYPSRHIDRRLTKLFSKYLSKHFILSMLYNSGDFDYLRHQLLRTSTHAEYDKTTHNLIIYNQTRDKNMQNEVMKPVDNNELTTRKRLIIHQRHEKRLGKITDIFTNCGVALSIKQRS